MKVYHSPSGAIFLIVLTESRGFTFDATDGQASPVIHPQSIIAMSNTTWEPVPEGDPLPAALQAAIAERS